ncbi:helix-turn-helix domain-containing protein [Bdellovibrio sp. NC01]|uniref:helix-turn-helix domain-containing protein n=1 Tax=Bdellovibrio sp. NC01 TaxID=2220073 RepID=UPI00143DCA98|nr:helix-turn-helix transcriptional regulator [Bdellovibrio sp. NC01]
MATRKTQTLTKRDINILKSIGANVKAERERQKLDVYDITGDDCLIKSRQHWQAIENGKKNINLTTLFKVAETLKVHPSKLLG